MPEEDSPEAVALEEAAEWRLRRLDADPADTESAAAARELQGLAESVRRLGASPLLAELHALCNWLGESDNISAFALGAQAYRERIGVDRHPESAEAYLRALIELAKEAM
jgi:hypothetical protein